ncbi:MAG: tyrosine-type recombinase/integrase [Xanthobacteraceae bacterium]|jgi:integrase
MATKSPRTFRKLTDRIIEGAIDFAEGEPNVFWDLKVHGLRIRLGRRRHSWSFFRQGRFRGRRYTVARRLGFYPSMGVLDARKAALALAGHIAEGKPVVGKRDALTLDTAIADYVESLKARGKKSARRVAGLARIHLSDLGKFTLAELSDSPALVRDHHAKISRDAPVSANRVMGILSAVYRHASRLDRSLPSASPISAVRMNKEEPAQTAMPFDQFGAWRQSVASLPPIRAAFYRFVLLTGFRSGEAGRLEWRDVNLKQRTITVRHAKAGADITVPLTSAIVRELKCAGHSSADTSVIFPGARKWADALPFKGHALRHTYRSVAADLGIDELQVRLLLGHSLVGISQGYVTRAVVEGGPGLKTAQRRISKRIVELLGGKI